VGGFEHFGANGGTASCWKAMKGRELPGLRQWKNALREHPDDEFFGFVE
jgi:hypothetical protein